MKHPFFILLLCASLLTGCAASTSNGRVNRDSGYTFVPDPRLRGKIVSVNRNGQFVVVDFNVSTVPPLTVRMNVYRDNDRVGVIHLTGPRDDNLVVGDIVSGDVAVGDAAIWDVENGDEPGPADR